MDKAISNEKDDNKNIHSEQGVKNNLQSSREKQTEEVCSNTRVVNENINEGGNIVKTRYGRIVKMPDRLMYPVIPHECLPSQHVGCCEKCQMVTTFTSIKQTLLHLTSCLTGQLPDILYSIMHIYNSFILMYLLLISVNVTNIIINLG